MRCQHLSVDNFAWLVYANYIERQIFLAPMKNNLEVSDLKTEITAKLNEYLANIGVSYIKLHNLHWNVVGSQFKAVHEYLETLYDALADVLDATAEVIKMNGEMPLASMKDYLSVATITELESKELDVKTTLETVLEDMQIMKTQAAELRKMADEEDQYDVVSMMESDLANYDKTIWFIASMLK